MPDRWCASAELRRRQIESGTDITFVDVFVPLFLERIIRIAPSRLIEIGAGTGHLSKALARKGLSVMAIEPSKGMYRTAKKVLEEEDVELVNCSSFELTTQKTFDLALSHLVAHVVDDLGGFLASVRAALKPDGYFLFSIPHPCFYNAYKGFFGSEYRYMTPMTKEVSFAITKDPDHRISGVPYHHRPISSYINAIVDSGMALIRLDEVYPPARIQQRYGGLWETPRYCMLSSRRI